MSNKDAEKSAETVSSTARPRQDPFADTRQLLSHDIPRGVDRRSFLMRTAVGGAAVVMTGCSPSPAEKTAKAVETLLKLIEKADASDRLLSVAAVADAGRAAMMLPPARWMPPASLKNSPGWSAA